MPIQQSRILLDDAPRDPTVINPSTLSMNHGLRFALLLWCCSIFSAHAIEQRIKVEGTWDGERFVVHKLKERDPNKDSSRFTIKGTVKQISIKDRELEIGPAKLSWTAARDTLFEDVVSGTALFVRAERVEDQRNSVLHAEPTELDSPNAVELIGTVLGSRRDNGLNEVSIGGVPVWAPKSLYRNGRVRLRRLDDRRPDDQFTTELGGVEIVIGGEIEFNLEVNGDRDLDSRNDDAALELEPGFQLESSFQFTDAVSAFLEMKGNHARDFDLPVSLNEQITEIQRGEMWVYIDQPFGSPFSVQIGRQNFAEDREWWWDADLDAVRIFYSSYRYQFDIGIAEQTFKENLNAGHAFEEDQDILRVLASAKWRHSTALTFDAFFLHQNDHSEGNRAGQIVAAHKEDESDGDLTWFGTRVSGESEVTDSVEAKYWVDWALVRGDEARYEFDDFDDDRIIVETATSGDRSGEAADLGASFTWSDLRWGHLYQPTVTLGYAIGSGDKDGDNFYRETDLNDNNGRFNGVDRFRYYGELADPKLENLGVSTVALGFRFANESSVELLHHHYRQAEKNDDHSLRLRSDVSGRSRNLGNEFDVVVGIEEWSHWELELVGAYFIPGKAFVDEDDAWQFAFKLNYNF